MKSSSYPIYHFFEKGLTLATSDTPCKDNGYSVYEKTESHGVPGLLTISLDMYGPDATPAVVVEEEEAVVAVSAPCCNVCEDPATVFEIIEYKLYFLLIMLFSYRLNTTLLTTFLTIVENAA